MTVTTAMDTIEKNLEYALSPDTLTAQITQVETVHLGFVEAFTENPLAALVVLGLLLAGISLACRAAIFLIVRVTGRELYDDGSRRTENLWMLLAFGAGFVCGEIFFRNVILGALTGVGFGIISGGAVLEALVTNEKIGEARREQSRRIEAINAARETYARQRGPGKV